MMIRTTAMMIMMMLLLQCVPVEILDLWQLEVLKLRDNPLTELPHDIDCLKNLRVLVASYCLLTTLPPKSVGSTINFV
jgi:Leucine-rich repeat (LRR) protein